MALNDEEQPLDYDKHTVMQLAAHVPDSVMINDHKTTMPGTTEFIGVALFADISGFTSLCESYADMGTTDATCGTDKLQATLNEYIGKIVDVIIKNGGDVLKFAGDAILASWRCGETGFNAKTTLTKAIRCSLAIQETCDNFMTGVGINLRVKIAIAVGTMCITYVGLSEAKQFDLHGSAVDDVGKTEKFATPGSVILSQLAWVNCDKKLFKGEEIENGLYFKTTENSTIPSNDNSTFTVGKGIANAFTDLFSSQANGTRCDANGNEIPLGSLKAVICPEFDAKLEKYVDYLVDVPKVLLLDDNDEVKASAVSYATNIPMKKAKGPPAEPAKQKKFDRASMTINLHQSEVEDLRAYVPKPVLDKIDNGQDLQWLSEMREVSVLFINMKLPFERTESALALQKAFELIYETAIQTKGNLNKVFGFDKGCTFVVIFGLPGDKYEDDAARALTCAHKVYEALHAVEEICDESIGVTTGRAFCGVIGHKNRHEYTVIGRKVNMAARLMMNYPGKLTCDAETYSASKSKLKAEDFTPQPFKELKGIKDPGIVREYSQNSKQSQNEAESFDFPIVGRNLEKDMFCKWLKKQAGKSTGNDTSTMVIEGVTGIGKTRLLEEFLDIAEGSVSRVIALSAETSQRVPKYYLMAALIKELLKITNKMSTVDKQSKLSNVIDDHLLCHFSALNDLLGTNIAPAEHVLHMSQDERDKEIAKLVCGIVNQEMNGQRCLITIDNAHLIDHASWYLIGNLQRKSDHGILLIMKPLPLISSILPSNAADAIKNESVRLIKLEPLPLSLMCDLACQFLGVKAIPKRLNEILQKRTNGVPSSCEQSIRDLVAMEAIQVVKSSLVELQDTTNTQVNNNDGPLDDLSPATRNERRKSVISGRSLKFSVSPGPGNSNNSKQMNQKSMPDSKQIQSTFQGESTDDNGDTVYYCEASSLVHASKDCMVAKLTSLCILNPEVDIEQAFVPNSAKSMVIAKLDRMSPNQQLLLKCASILGLDFSKDILKAIVPKSNTPSFDVTLYNLCRENILQCASLAPDQIQEKMQVNSNDNHHHHHHHHNTVVANSSSVYCGCHMNDGLPLLNLSINSGNKKKRTCQYFRFTYSYVQEAAYALWLEDQRKGLHERAAIYLESIGRKCSSCGGNSFTPPISQEKMLINSIAMDNSKGFPSHYLSKPVSGSHSNYVNQSVVKSRSSSAWANKAEVIGAQHSARKASLGINRKANHIRSNRITHDGKQQDSKADGIGKALVDITALLVEPQGDKTRKKSFLNVFTKRSKVDPKPETLGLALLSDLKKYFNQEEASPVNDKSNATDRAITVHKHDVARCRCAYLLAFVYPQLARHWRFAGNEMKAFRYMTGAAFALSNIGKGDEALKLLETLQERIRSVESNSRAPAFSISIEERSMVKSLLGQTLSMMGRCDEAKKHFLNALSLLGLSQPTNKLGVWHRTNVAWMVQSLHCRMPGVFIDSGGENSSILVEQAKCLSHLADLLLRGKDYNLLFMVALQQLNATEEAEDSWNELMTSYTLMLQCCQLTGRIKLGSVYSKIGQQRCHIDANGVEQMVILCHFYGVAMLFHLYVGGINEAIELGFKGLEMAESINDVKLKLIILPSIIRALILMGRVQAAKDKVETLRNLLQKVKVKGLEAIYFCSCLDIILEAGSPVERMTTCYSFAASCRTELNKTVDDAVHCYLEAAIALWFARKENWSAAQDHLRFAQGLNPLWKDNSIEHWFFMSRVAEIELLYVRSHISDQSAWLKSGNSLKAFEAVCQSSSKCLFKPRLYHLQAYQCLLKKKSSRASLILEDCIVASQASSVYLEGEHAGLSKRVWFTNYNPYALNEYEDNTMFAFPIPSP